MKSIINKSLQFLLSIRHAWVLLGYVLMGIIFNLMEKINANVSLWISCALDDFIPFFNVFVIPYIAWYLFIFAVLAVLIFTDKKGLYKACTVIYLGMMVAYLIYWLIPHGQPLRVSLTEADKNIFDRLVLYIYSHDTPTNTFPSIHVLNSMAANYALQTTPFFANKKGLRIGGHVLNILIIMSTVLIKQHSILDVIAAIVLAYLIRFLVYSVDWKAIFSRKPVKTRCRGQHIKT